MQNTPVFVYRSGLITDKSYVEWLSELKQRFQKSQVKAAIRVNSAMLEFYWSLGRDMNSMRAESKWGSGFYNQLSLDLKEMFPEQTGFSVTNLKYMKRWYAFYNEMLTIRQRPVDENRHQAGDELAEQIFRKRLRLANTQSLLPASKEDIKDTSRTINILLYYDQERTVAATRL